jgi:SAM-dependent methyltransferase
MMTMLVRALVLAVALVAPTYTPQIGQDGKDVIWVPTPDALVERMLTMAQVTPADHVVDLGSGDGRLVIVAAKQFGARARGIEFNAELVALAQTSAKQAGLTPAQARMEQGDIFTADFRAATVVTLYLLPALNRRLRPILLAMRPGTRVVSHQFGMEDWTPDETSYVEQRAAHLWIVPARVGGGWLLSLPDGSSVELDLEQRHQQIDGRVQLGPVKAGLRGASLRGDVIRFSFVDPKGALLVFVGRVLVDRIVGTVQSGPTTARWSAVVRR